ncbi:hypothetical protein FIA58_015870 [Flavobacterium jejuense]|uniref:Gliding motility-associated protein GldM C-terminal domain-containing protein n=1 Tax=Flavobacterium jejuense TaxID=1544455 RepID=A0ABX0IVG2_9FLAO|nr:GldM family protein [Flavobacterium jejuense]NHN27160.1 hypothetical protein [Flavobacterium jejuense]
MKKLLLLIFVFCFQTIFSQKVVVRTFFDYGVLYYGVQNPVDIIVEGEKCKDLKIIVDDKIISGNNCNYTILPKKIGEIEIAIYKKSKLVGKQKLQVIDIIPVATLTAPENENGEKIIQNAHNLTFLFKGLTCSDINIPKLEYKVTIIRKDKVVFSNVFHKRVFTEELRKELQTLQKEDLILFTDIKVTLINDLQLTSESLVFRITYDNF